MNKKTTYYLIIVVIFLILVSLGFYFYPNSLSFLYNQTEKSFVDNDELTEKNTKNDLPGCYVATLSDDVYSLRIDSYQNGEVVGFLSYNNAYKDSSSGKIKGIYDGKLLIADYSFYSEGVFSVRQVVFRKTENGFQEGFGPSDVKDNKEYILDLEKLTFPDTHTFVKKETGCDKL